MVFIILEVLYKISFIAKFLLCIHQLNLIDILNQICTLALN